MNFKHCNEHYSINEENFIILSVVFVDTLNPMYGSLVHKMPPHHYQAGSRLPHFQKQRKVPAIMELLYIHCFIGLTSKPFYSIEVDYLILSLVS